MSKESAKRELCIQLKQLNFIPDLSADKVFFLAILNKL